MNLLSARVVLRPRSLADVLDLALPFCVRNRRPLARLALALLAPIAALAFLLRARAHWSWPWVWCLVAEASFLVEGGFTVAFGQLLFQDAPDVRAASILRQLAVRAGPFLITFVGRQLLLVASLALIFVPFLQGPATLFVGEALLLERASPTMASTRSRALARHRGGFCAGLWLGTLALPVLGALIADQLGNALVGFVLQLGQPTGNLFVEGGSGFAVVGVLLAAPVAAAARFLGYIDLRTRKEGWDIQLRFLALAGDSAAGQGRVS